MPRLAINGGENIRTEPWPHYPVFGDREKQAVARVIDSGWLAAHHNPAGRGEAEAFEEAFAEWNNSTYVLGIGNGTQGLHLALAAAGIGVGDEVIVPTLTFRATATPVMMQNAVPIFADSETAAMGLDPRAVEARITARTKAIIPVHFCGYPADMDGLLTVARKHRLIVIEDCSHAHGAVYHDTKVGNLGDIAVFSLQQKKNLSTGDGGLLVTDDEDYARSVRDLRSFGHQELSYNYRMTEVAAAIGQVRLSLLDEHNETRRANARVVARELAETEGITVFKPAPETESVYYSLLFDYDAEVLDVPRERLIAAVQAEGIPLAPSYQPVHRHANFHPTSTPARGCPWQWALYDAPETERPRFEDGCCPVAEHYCDQRLMELKIHPPAAEKDMLQAAAAIRKVVENADELK